RARDATRGRGVELAVEVLGDDQDFGHFASARCLIFLLPPGEGAPKGRMRVRVSMDVSRRTEPSPGLRPPSPDGRGEFRHTNPFCFNNPTNSATSFTITPRERLAGGA